MGSISQDPTTGTGTGPGNTNGNGIEEDTPLPYWQVNVPPQDREPTCPDFLLSVSPKDKGILSTPDSQYVRQSWPSVVSDVKENRIDRFQRVPSELRKYLAYNWMLKREYGSVMAFVVGQRLHWDDKGGGGGGGMQAKGKGAFECPEEDVKVLWNDWPYGIDEKIVHLVVWTKFDLEEDPETGDLTDRARGQIEEWVAKEFGGRVERDKYIWFKNWKSLKSIHAVEHFHVMLYDPDPEFVKEITNGDVPLVAKVK